MILILSILWLVLTPFAGFWGGLLLMIDTTCAHWSLPAAQEIWALSAVVYLICGVSGLVFYKNKKYGLAFKTAIVPVFWLILQLLSYPFLHSPIRDCNLYIWVIASNRSVYEKPPYGNWQNPGVKMRVPLMAVCRPPPCWNSCFVNVCFSPESRHPPGVISSEVKGG